MSVRGFTKDLIYLYVMIGLIIVSILTLYYYFTTNDETTLYMGLALAGMIVFVAIAKYRYWADTVMTRVRKWR